MPSSLNKTRKQISKKRNGVMDSMHRNSRDSKRLHKAQVRDERLEKLAEARKKKDQPLLGRVSFFQEFVQENGLVPLDLDIVRSKINEFVHQFDEEYEETKKSRRPGRPPSAREDLLKLKISALEREQQDGFFIPDLTTQENIELLNRWEGSWSYLSSLAWVKVSGDNLRPSSFPPK